MSRADRGLDRRTFLKGAATGGAALALGACADDTDGRSSATSAATQQETLGGARRPPPVYVPFEGVHQSGITTPVPPIALTAALDITAADRDELAEAFRALTDEARRLMSGRPYPAREPSFPPIHTGTLGEAPPPTDLSVVVSVGASLFDDRFGLTDHKPRSLVTMPFLANDRLDPARSHGDVLLSVMADSPDATLFALRQLLRRTRGELAVRWMVEGFNRHNGTTKPGEAGVRNLMGFRDGTANLDASSTPLMERYVWVAEDDGEPAWAVGGSYHVVRVIRMFVEFWDRTSLSEQEALIGRHKESGAPLGGSLETDPLDFADDPEGERVPLTAHIRLANPRTPETEGDLILRRGLSFSRGFDDAGRLDQGLAFVSFQRRLVQFLNTQARLKDEGLEEYILPVGGGFFFALPGVRDADDWFGRALFT
jgi:deferrochelatase/peroxidase EfeB